MQGKKVIVTKGRRKGETGILVRFEWVNMLNQDMWLVEFDNNMPDGYIDQKNFKLI